MSYQPRQDDYEQFLDEFNAEVDRRYDESLATSGAAEGESSYYIRRLPETLFNRLRDWTAAQDIDRAPGLAALAQALDEAQQVGSRSYQVIVPEIAHEWLQHHKNEVRHALDAESRTSYLKFTRAFVA